MKKTYNLQFFKIKIFKKNVKYVCHACRVSHKFVLTLYLRLKQNTLRFDIIMTTQYVPHFMGYHMNTRCGMPPAEFRNVAGLK